MGEDVDADNNDDDVSCYFDDSVPGSSASVGLRDESHACSDMKSGDRASADGSPILHDTCATSQAGRHVGTCNLQSSEPCLEGRVEHSTQLLTFDDAAHESPSS